VTGCSECHALMRAVRRTYAVIALLVLVSTIPACALAPHTLRLEAEHVSHPLAGWPVSGHNTEDAVTQASALLHWRAGPAYFDAGIGRNLRGANGGGFYGPAITGTVRAGLEVPLR